MAELTGPADPVSAAPGCFTTVCRRTATSHDAHLVGSGGSSCEARLARHTSAGGLKVQRDIRTSLDNATKVRQRLPILSTTGVESSPYARRVTPDGCAESPTNQDREGAVMSSGEPPSGSAPVSPRNA